MSSLIIFVLGVIAVSLIACLVLSACVFSEMAGKMQHGDPEGGEIHDHGHYEREGKASDHHDI